jgi:hypothetical protein
MNEVKAKSYTLRTENDNWLGQIVITTDGMFSGVTDYGNFGFAWRSTGEEDFRNFILRLNTDYFADKMYQGISYMAYCKKYQQSAKMFAEKILPALQEVLKKEIELELK